MPGLASACRRAATLGVSPSASVSWRVPAAAPHLAHDDEPGVDADAHLQRTEAGTREGLEYAEGGADGPLGVVLVGLRVAEVDQQPIAQVLRDVPAVGADHPRAHPLVGPHQLAEFLRVQRRREGGGAHQVAEQHRQLAPLGRGRTGAGRGGGARVCPGAEWPSHLRAERYLAGQRRTARGAELRLRGGRLPAARAPAPERRTALQAELRPRRVTGVAARAPHHPPLALGVSWRGAPRALPATARSRAPANQNLLGRAAV